MLTEAEAIVHTLEYIVHISYWIESNRIKWGNETESTWIVVDSIFIMIHHLELLYFFNFDRMIICLGNFSFTNWKCCNFSSFFFCFFHLKWMSTLSQELFFVVTFLRNRFNLYSNEFSDRRALQYEQISHFDWINKWMHSKWFEAISSWCRHIFIKSQLFHLVLVLVLFLLCQHLFYILPYNNVICIKLFVYIVFRFEFRIASASLAFVSI